MLLAGIGCATIISVASYANIQRLESKLGRLEAQCVEEGEKDTSEWAEFKLVCEAGELMSSGITSVGIQVQIVKTQEEIWSSSEWLFFLAALVLLLSAIPWAWYFLLRRIRELRDAITGK